MKGKVVFPLLALLGTVVCVVYGSERVTTASSVGPSPLFAASLNRSIGELEGRIPKGKARSCNLRARAAPAKVDDTSLAPDCTQYSGCVVTIGGPSCDYSLCEGCNYTFFNSDYTCNGGPSCGPPTMGDSPTCSGWSTCANGSTCGASTCFGGDTCNPNSTACNGGLTSSGNTCGGPTCFGSGGTTCSGNNCTPPTSFGLPTCDNRPGGGCDDNRVTVTGQTCSEIFATCSGATCSGFSTCNEGLTCQFGYTCESVFSCEPGPMQ